LNYKESIPAPSLPDSEHGFIPSVAGGVIFLGNGNLYLALDGAVNFGDAHYNGANFYTNAPLTGTTHEAITTIDGKFGRGFGTGNAMLIPYIDIGYRYWDRNLGGGQVEDYQNFAALGGLMLQVAPTSRLVLSAYGAAGTTFAANMKSDGNNYDLGGAGTYRLGGKVGYNLTPRVELFGTLDYDHFRYAQSSVQYDYVLASYANEPGSGTSETTMRVGLGYQFR
jgi:hypothetical protein